MSVSKPTHNGKSPARLWCAWQYTKGFIGACFHKGGRVSAAFMTAGAGVAGYAGWIIGSSIAAASFTIAGMALPVIGGGIAFFLGARNFSAIKNSDAYQDYMRKRYDAWLAKKRGPSLKARIASLFTRLGTLTGAAAALAGLAYVVLPLVGVAVPAITIGTLSAMTITYAAAALVPVGAAAALLCRHATRKLLGKTKKKEKEASGFLFTNSAPSQPSFLKRSLSRLFKGAHDNHKPKTEQAFQNSTSLKA